MKIDLVIPKGTKCKNGVCEQDIEIENLELPDINPVVTRVPEVQVNSKARQQTIQEPIHEEKTPDVKIQKVVPSWQPKFICKGPNCNTKNNPGYTQRPKGKCPNCGQFSKESVGSCIWCDNKELEEIDEEELDNLGVPRPEESAPNMEEVD